MIGEKEKEPCNITHDLKCIFTGGPAQKKKNILALSVGFADPTVSHTLGFFW